MRETKRTLNRTVSRLAASSSLNTAINSATQKRSNNKLRYILFNMSLLEVENKYYCICRDSTWLLTVSIVSSQSVAKKCIGFHTNEKTIDYRDAFLLMISIIIDNHVRNISGIESENEW